MIGIFPTDTVYGLGCKIGDKGQESLIYRFKERPKGKLLPVLFSHLPGELDWRENGKFMPALVSLVWPGKSTLVVDMTESLSKYLRGAWKAESIGIRVSDHPGVVEMQRILKSPVLSTSANLSGDRECNAIADIPNALKEKVDIILDGGVLPTSLPSTVLDCRSWPPQILREGAVSGNKVAEIIGKCEKIYK